MTWTSEKLLFLRVEWGRVQFSDLLIDVGLGQPIYEEAARFATGAFEQYRSGCLGQCPFAAVPGSADSLRDAPRPRPAGGEGRGLDALVQGLAYLDVDWDGRVFSDAGGRRFTLSRVKGKPGRGREEYPIEVLERRSVDGGWWLLVSIYDRSRCGAEDAAPVHRGWVPAYSATGRLVGGTWSRGC